MSSMSRGMSRKMGGTPEAPSAPPAPPIDAFITDRKNVIIVDANGKKLISEV